jgi:hypothetical protein
MSAPPELFSPERWLSYPPSVLNAPVDPVTAIAYMNGEIGDQELLAAPSKRDSDTPAENNRGSNCTKQ